MYKLQLKTNTALVEVIDSAQSQAICTELFSKHQDPSSGLVGLVVTQQGAKYEIVRILEVGEQLDLPNQPTQVRLKPNDLAIISAGAISTIEGIKSPTRRGFIFTDNVLALAVEEA